MIEIVNLEYQMLMYDTRGFVMFCVNCLQKQSSVWLPKLYHPQIQIMISITLKSCSVLFIYQLTYVQHFTNCIVATKPYKTIIHTLRQMVLKPLLRTYHLHENAHPPLEQWTHIFILSHLPITLKIWQNHMILDASKVIIFAPSNVSY